MSGISVTMSPWGFGFHYERQTLIEFPIKLLFLLLLTLLL